MARKPNWYCEGCNVSMYRRPFEFERDTHRRCQQCYQPRMEDVQCPTCKVWFHPSVKVQIYCTQRCAGKARCVGTYTKDRPKNAQQARLALLKETFAFAQCMVEGCTYSTTYDVHRHIPGKEGGEYKIGNMFAICPNHHAEVTRRLVKLAKVDDYTLRVVT